MTANVAAKNVTARPTLDQLPECRLNVIDASGAVIGIIALAPKDFKSGSIGLTGSAKVVIAKRNYQVGVNAVLIGSKPKA